MEVTKNVSTVASYTEVRSVMVSKQRLMGENGGVVMDGRDIGTVVFPNAELKVFMLADPIERAGRRFKEFQDLGKQTTLEEVLNDLTERDRQDATRSVGPLKKADDARELDTTHFNPRQVLDQLLSWTREAEEKRLKE
eukprot:TRINITY_DN638_c0_g1_i2.p1 TRINITY_DN638_c0_g1~~TRINITY_DN638_c0_g1_i2.p1  ORF type:complete len:138 (+),score=32.36 TRINITY_DN638_c0_g1_i2:387-800(+)